MANSGRSRQHGPGPGQDEGGAELHVPQGRQGDSSQRLEGQEEVVEALVEGVEGVWPGLLGRTSEGLAGQGPLPGDGLHVEDEDVECGGQDGEDHGGGQHERSIHETDGNRSAQPSHRRRYSPGIPGAVS